MAFEAVERLYYLASAAVVAVDSVAVFAVVSLFLHHLTCASVLQETNMEMEEGGDWDGDHLVEKKSSPLEAYIRYRLRQVIQMKLLGRHFPPEIKKENEVQRKSDADVASTGCVEK